MDSGGTILIHWDWMMQSCELLTPGVASQDSQLQLGKRFGFFY